MRLLPWLLAPFVTARLSVPFGRVLVEGALEAALVVGVPVGLSIAAARFTERGEYRALSSLGASPVRVLRGLVIPLVLACTGLALLAATGEREVPGRLAARLLAAGRAACLADKAPPRSDVPLLGVSWLCLANGPRAAGRVPGMGEGAWFTAAGIEPTEELRSLALRDLSVAGRLSGHPVSLRVERADIAGLPGWGRRPLLTGSARATVIGAFAAALGILAALLALTSGLGPVEAAVAATLGTVAALSALRALDGGQGPVWKYAGMLAAGVTAQSLAFWLLALLRRPRVARRGPE